MLWEFFWHFLVNCVLRIRALRNRVSQLAEGWCWYLHYKQCISTKYILKFGVIAKTIWRITYVMILNEINFAIESFVLIDKSNDLLTWCYCWWKSRTSWTKLDAQTQVAMTLRLILQIPLWIVHIGIDMEK